MVDMDQNALLAQGVTPRDVTAAINAQNLTLPSGTAKIGTREYTVSTNSSPVDALSLNDVPVKTVNGSLVYMRDIAHVRRRLGRYSRMRRAPMASQTCCFL